MAPMTSSCRALAPVRLLALSILSFLLAGCVTLPDEDVTEDGTFAQPVYVLHYTLRDLAGETRMPAEDHHCPAAWEKDGELVMTREAQKATKGATALALVDPTWVGAWADSGGEPYAMALPGVIESRDASIDEPFIRLGGADGQVTVDGKAVSLPYAWARTAKDGSWRVEGRIADGPDKVRVVEGGMCL